MDKSMADDLNVIKQSMVNHSELLTQLVSLNERQVASNDKLNDHIIRSDKRMDKLDSRQDELTKKVQTNHSTIMKWSGGIAAIIAFASFLCMLARLFPGIGG